MHIYSPPLRDISFALYELAGLVRDSYFPESEENASEVITAVLEEAGRFAAEVLAPLSRSGDKEGVNLSEGQVHTATGFRDAYLRFSENGWNALSCPVQYGGHGLPRLLSAAVNEMWKSANHAFSLCPMLTMGAIEALSLYGTEAQKTTYLPNMVSGHWTGTMNLTEPQAGSDLAAIRTRAVPHHDGTYRLFGEKIFITWGDHDMTENIVHLVLARTPGAPTGVRGISLFVVPKYLVREDGSIGSRNDVHCVSLERKLGIHASPTCVMAYGNNEGAVGTLVGKENEGLKYMFAMMNAARFAVGLEGLAVAEAAFQKAKSYAKDRVQSRAIEGSVNPVAIIHHPDVRRMLMTMKAQIEAMRGLAYTVAAAQDHASHHPDISVRQQQQSFVDLMTPVIKGWLTETGNEIASLGLQIHGGMGYIEETGASQYFRDARITTIYEGTTGIQANDLIGRKVVLDEGKAARHLLLQMRTTLDEMTALKDSQWEECVRQLARGISSLECAIDHIVGHYKSNVQSVAASGVIFLKLLGIVSGGWIMAKAALASGKQIQAGSTDGFYRTKIETSHFYSQHFLPLAPALAEIIIHGGASVLFVSTDEF
ncbi:acyl-CoA dehydrogenase [Denitratisoma oestradiolicum]|uniref:3-methylmercaptopropionyl-CoA dehydrogenase n=1 Tax=Denitratisoma oestradiolicum TaxID=311182 RepID=A0A6S6YAD5_9PROT|nr:acyl-CoA dehydrogenase [Denitratisoma oestradiolicum]TWO78719.1 acyl-CoA dehydrogenase [Denitratisoma oestradiolicum]CAB1369562.1 3-methylmercaptopropionyl-CoA dehydrogenase [Denitratisoma oestradiolicum]